MKKAKGDLPKFEIRKEITEAGDTWYVTFEGREGVWEDNLPPFDPRVMSDTLAKETGCDADELYASLVDTAAKLQPETVTA